MADNANRFCGHDSSVCRIFRLEIHHTWNHTKKTFVVIYRQFTCPNSKTKGLLRKTTASFTLPYLKTLKKRCYMTRFVRLWQTSSIIPCSVPFLGHVQVTRMLKMNYIYFQSTQLCHKWIRHLQKPLKPSKNHQNLLADLKILWLPEWSGVQKIWPPPLSTVYTQMNQNMQ